MYANEYSSGSDSSSEFSCPSDVKTHAINRNHTPDGIFKKRRCPEKATGYSMLSYLLKRERRTTLGARTKIRPPPGFEHLGPKNVVNNVPHPASQHRDEDNLMPPPELMFLCPSVHPCKQKPTPNHEKAQRPTGNPEGSTVVRPTQKALPLLQSCLDYRFVPWISNEYVERDDFILFDELHQLCTF